MEANLKHGEPSLCSLVGTYIFAPAYQTSPCKHKRFPACLAYRCTSAEDRKHRSFRQLAAQPVEAVAAETSSKHYPMAQQAAAQAARAGPLAAAAASSHGARSRGASFGDLPDALLSHIMELAAVKLYRWCVLLDLKQAAGAMPSCICSAQLRRGPPRPAPPSPRLPLQLALRTGCIKLSAQPHPMGSLCP